MSVTNWISNFFVSTVALLCAGSGIADPVGVIDENDDLILTRQKNCFVCHDIDRRNIGPALQDVRNKYIQSNSSENHLVSKILNGGSGAWGQIPMPPNQHVSESEARSIAKWILSTDFPKSLSKKFHGRDDEIRNKSGVEFRGTILNLYEKAKILIQREVGLPNDNESIKKLKDVEIRLDKIFGSSQEKSSKEFSAELARLAEGRVTNISRNMLAELDSVKIIAWQLSKFDIGIALAQIELKVWEKSYAQTHRFVEFLFEFAEAYEYLGEYDLAIDFYQRAIDVAWNNKHLRYENIAYRARYQIGSLYINLGFCEKGLNSLRAAVPVIMFISDAQLINSVDLKRKSNALHASGKYDEAEKQDLDALHIVLQGAKHSQNDEILTRFGDAYACSDNLSEALIYYQLALALVEKAKGAESVDAAYALNKLSLVFMELGNVDESIRLANRALSLMKDKFGEESVYVSLVLDTLAKIQEKRDDQRSLTYLLKSLAIKEKFLGEDNPSTGDSYKSLGEFYVKHGSPKLAAIFYKLAVNVRQSTRERISRIGKSELASYTRSVESVYQNLAALLIEDARLPEAHEVLDLLKEDEFFEFIRRSETKDPVRTKIKPNPSEQKWISQYRSIADHLFVLGQEENALEKIPSSDLTTAQQSRLKQIKAELAIANMAFSQFMGDIKSAAVLSKKDRSADIEQLNNQAQIETRAILKALGEDVALLQYFITDNELGMLVTTDRLQKAYTTKISAKDLNTKISLFTRQIKARVPVDLGLAEELYRLIFEPVATDLVQAGIRTVMISADGALRYLPFAALYDGKDYLVKRFALPVYTSVQRQKLRDASLPQWTGAGLGVTKAHGDLKALPAVRDELQSIMGKTVPGDIYLDQAFTAKQLQEVGRQHLPVVHIASHFQFSPGTELNSFLLLGDGSQLNLGELRTGDYQFAGVDLLTLSACETGLGGARDNKGREIEGFGVIAQQKGARAVIATLWPVEDASTAWFMAELYRNRQAKSLSKIEALRQAQIALQMQAKYVHPYFWAPFILMGNWR